MSEKVFGILRVVTQTWRGNVQENMFISADRVVVGRKAESGGRWAIVGGLFGGVFENIIVERKAKQKEKEYLELPLEEILKADKKNYAIPLSDITEVELKKQRFGVISILFTMGKKKQAWIAQGLIPEKEGVVTLEDYEDILRLAFPDRLTVKK